MRRLATLLVTLTAAVYFGLFLGYGMELEDEGLILSQTQRTLAGELPYVDFDTGYTPGVFYLNAELFRRFGVRTLPVRAALVVVNSLAIGLLFVLVRPWAGGVLAAAAALGYAAFLPVFPGQFASFNIPYPAWYAALAWLATQAAIDRHLRRSDTWSLLLAGLGAGAAFTFKPNAGALAVIACGVSLAMPAAGAGDPDRRLARVLLALAALAVLALPFVDLELSVDSLLFNFGLVAFPLLMLLVGRMVAAPAAVANGGRLARRIAIVAAGALIVMLPWATFFFHRLGPARFVREVMLIGTGAEALYGTTYPIAFELPGLWAVVAVGLAAAFAAAGFLVERRPSALPWVLAAIASAALIAGVRFVDLARMPEGLAISVVLQLQVACFVAVPPLAVLAVHRALRRLRARERCGVEHARWLATLAFAACMYLLLYPRMDSMHLMTALPSMLVVAAAAARRLARAWSTAFGVDARLLIGAGALLVAVLAAVSAGPGVAGALDREQTTLAEPRLPVRVETERSYDLVAFSRMLQTLRERLAPGDRVFGFPAMGLVSYALDRPAFVRWEYFFPGRPNHDEEAEVLTTLERVAPRFIVTLNERLGYFFESPIYYFLLRPYVREHYTLVARAGRYDVLERHVEGAALTAPIVFADALPTPTTPSEAIDWMADPDRARRHVAMRRFLEMGGDGEGVAGLADRWAPDERRRLLLVRMMGEAGDERGLELLGRALHTTKSRRMRNEVAGALLILSLRDTQAPYLLGGDGRTFPGDAWRALDFDRLRARLATRNGRLEFGLSASYAFAAAGERAAIPVLEEVLQHRGELDRAVAGTWLRVAIGEALVRLGRPEYLCHLVDLLGIDRHEVQDMMPSRLILEARRAPEAARRCLAQGLGGAEPLAREVTAYVIAAIPLPALAPELTVLRADPDARVRRAADWALTRLGAARP